MARLLSTKEPLRFVPPDQAERPEDEQVAYHILPPSVYSAPKLNRAVKSQGARLVTMVDILDALDEGLRALLPEDAQAETLATRLATVEDYRRWLMSEDKKERLRAILDQDHAVHGLFRIVSRHYPKLSDLSADMDWYWDVLGIEAARLQVSNWENLTGPDGEAVPCKRGLEGLTDASLQAIPERHLKAIGLYVHGLLSPSEAEAKNSESPPPGPSAPSSSKATAKKPPQKSRSKTTPGRSRKSASTN